jgi:membrane associated rhomboid family serine protease
VQIDVPDPAFSRSARARANFRLGRTLALAFVGVLWFVHLLNWLLDTDPAGLGVRPRELEGLIGILFAPLAHGDFSHLLANSPPLTVLGTVMLTLYPRSSPRVLAVLYFGPGIAVWLFARDASHLGASGLVYGLASFVFVAGLLRRDRRALAAAMLVAFMYGALVWGLVPIRSTMSWETHLAAALLGAAMAIALRRLDQVPMVRYAWEGETEPDTPATSEPVEFDIAEPEPPARRDLAR